MRWWYEREMQSIKELSLAIFEDRTANMVALPYKIFITMIN